MYMWLFIVTLSITHVFTVVNSFVCIYHLSAQMPQPISFSLLALLEVQTLDKATTTKSQNILQSCVAHVL